MTRRTSTLSIDGWRQGLRFAASHVVPYHPKCGKLHGHTYAVNCELEGDVPDDGMVMDFGDVKDELRRLSDELDHQWMLPREPEHGDLTVDDDRVVYQVQGKRWDVPREDVMLVDLPVCTAENIAHYLADQITKTVAFPDTVTKIRIGVDEGYGKGAWVTREL